MLHEVADPLVDAADAPESANLLRVGQPGVIELRHARGCDRSLSGGGSTGAEHAAEVARLSDETAVCFTAPLPSTSEDSVDRRDSSGHRLVDVGE